MDLVNFKAREPNSPEYLVDILRGLLETAFSEKISYMQIEIKVEGEPSIRSFSCVSPPSQDAL